MNPDRPNAPPFMVAEIVSARQGKAASPLRVGAALPDPPFDLMTDAGPAGFDIALMRRITEAIRQQAVLTRAMPPNNFSGMTDEERAVLARWLKVETAQN